MAKSHKIGNDINARRFRCHIEQIAELVFLPAVISRTWLTWCHAELGTFAAGRAFGEEGLWIAKAVDHQASLVYGYAGIGLLALRQGDLAQALPLLKRAVDICHEIALSFLALRHDLGCL